MIRSLSVTDTNLSAAWARTFLELMERGGGCRHPSVVTINCADTQGIENPAIRELLDLRLKSGEAKQCRTVAGTIFPHSMWNAAAKDNAAVLYARYDKAWPGIARCPANRNGVYFRRLTSYLPKGHSGKPVNQLKTIVETYLGGNHRKSALQAAILDPTRDNSNSPVRGFPCLQQVSFTPLEHNRLSVTGYYATQYQFEKAYGNYLGLYWLGCFMAEQLGLKLTQVVCLASMLCLGDESKSALRSFETSLRKIVKPG